MSNRIELNAELISKEMESAERLIQEMRNAGSLTRYEDSWKLFLMQLDAIWNKCFSLASKAGVPKGVTDNIISLRRTDDLLSYLMQARNSHEHTLQQIVEKVPGKVTIAGEDGGGAILSGYVSGNGETGLQTIGNIQVEFHPENLIVTDLVNRNKSYNVPASHLGQQISTKSPHELAEMGLRYYKNCCEEICNRVQT